MKRRLIIVSFLLIILTMTGCAKVVVRSDSDPGVNLAQLKTFYVQKLPVDKRGLEKIIASKLNDFGFQTTYGTDAIPADRVDAVVTYKDRWMWDITNYMLEINIEFHDYDTGFVFANGKSYRTSLARKPPEEMIDEVLRDIFAGKIDLPPKNSNKKEQ